MTTRLKISIILSLLAPGLASAQADSSGDSGFRARFTDPVDGRFDITASGEGGRGFLPLIIPFNEPAVGPGAVAGVVYFHPDSVGAAEDGAAAGNVPPTMSFAGAARSENDSRVLAAGHSRVFSGGRVRYLGLLTEASVNLDYYGAGDNPVLSDNPLAFNLDGAALLQQAQFQLGASRVAIGLRFSFLDAVTSFDITPGDGAGHALGDTQDSGIGVFLNWDTRDTSFTPNAGRSVKARLSRFSEELGGDFNYSKASIASRQYWSLRNERLIIGLRADANYIGDNAPFYAMSFVTLRGVPAFRYLGNYTMTLEAEPTFKIDERWSVLGFAGVGRAATEASKLDDAESVYNYGLGFRYLLARRLGLGAGIDVARGPEDTAIYLTFGSAWGF